MKKILTILALISLIFLIGCDNAESKAKQTQVEIPMCGNYTINPLRLLNYKFTSVQPHFVLTVRHANDKYKIYACYRGSILVDFIVPFGRDNVDAVSMTQQDNYAVSYRNMTTNLESFEKVVYQNKENKETIIYNQRLKNYVYFKHAHNSTMIMMLNKNYYNYLIGK